MFHRQSVFFSTPSINSRHHISRKIFFAVSLFWWKIQKCGVTSVFKLNQAFTGQMFHIQFRPQKYQSNKLKYYTLKIYQTKNCSVVSRTKKKYAISMKPERKRRDNLKVPTKHGSANSPGVLILSLISLNYKVRRFLSPGTVQLIINKTPRASRSIQPCGAGKYNTESTRAIHRFYEELIHVCRSFADYFPFVRRLYFLPVHQVKYPWTDYGISSRGSLLRYIIEQQLLTRAWVVGAYYRLIRSRGLN